jgi:hypothetical protein
MKIAGIYSFNDGQNIIMENYFSEWEEVKNIIQNVDATICKTKISKEKTKEGRKLYQPSSLNKAFKKYFYKLEWTNHRISCEYSDAFYTSDDFKVTSKGAFREMDFVKNRMGVEVQLGKYAFMVYNICAKMTIFNKRDVIDVGIEIVPIKKLAQEMSSGVSYFEQFAWDLENRGIADIDIPVLVLGISA